MSQIDMFFFGGGWVVLKEFFLYLVGFWGRLPSPPNKVTSKSFKNGPKPKRKGSFPNHHFQRHAVSFRESPENEWLEVGRALSF